MANDYKIGRCRPPLETRFKKGQSGNPLGRPKGSRNPRTIWREALTQQVKVKKNGKAQTVTTAEALVMAIIQKAATGDLKALQYVLDRALEFLEHEIESAQELDPGDEAILEGFRRRRDKEGQR